MQAALAAAVPAVKTETMKAMVHRAYGEPEVLTPGVVPVPVPGPNEVRVRVASAGVTIGDHHVITGKPYLIRLTPFGGLPRPRHLVPGQTVAGRVDAVGANVTSLRVGDEVFGHGSTGAFAEYVVVPADLLVPKPKNLSFDEAAATPWGATALLALKGVKPGARVLINGASGGVGTWAVQIAKSYGAHVTAVCSTRNLDKVRALGADEVLDYTTHDFAAGGARFDLLLDLVGNRPLSVGRSVLLPGGTYVPCSGGGGDWVGPMLRIVWGLLSFAFTSKKFLTFVAMPNREDLLTLKALTEAGTCKPVIDRRYPLAQLPEALAHVGAGHSQGQTVVQVASV